MFIMGFVPPDGEYRKMAAVWKSCEDAGVPIPDEVSKYFRHEPPTGIGFEVNLETDRCCSEYKEDMIDGFEIDVDKIPENIKIIRVYMNY